MKAHFELIIAPNTFIKNCAKLPFINIFLIKNRCVFHTVDFFLEGTERKKGFLSSQDGQNSKFVWRVQWPREWERSWDGEERLGKSVGSWEVLFFTSSKFRPLPKVTFLAENRVRNELFSKKDTIYPQEGTVREKSNRKGRRCHFQWKALPSFPKK